MCIRDSTMPSSIATRQTLESFASWVIKALSDQGQENVDSSIFSTCFRSDRRIGLISAKALSSLEEWSCLHQARAHKSAVRRAVGQAYNQEPVSYTHLRAHET